MFEGSWIIQDTAHSFMCESLETTAYWNVLSNNKGLLHKENIRTTYSFTDEVFRGYVEYNECTPYFKSEIL